jgi:ABC-type multidrug transport system fused ATPase/permease subunit
VEAFTALTTIAIATSPLATFLAASKYLSSSLGSFSRIEEFLLSDTYEDCRQIKACPEDATLLATRPSPDLQSGPKQMQTFVDSVELNELGSSFPDQASETIIKVENASFRANKDTTVLHNISMEVGSGTLSMIVGRVGCGKSSLLRAMAGEIAKQGGNIEISVSSMAYCSQKPWLRNVSVRDNILGQSAYDEAWFATVTKACALTEDIEAFPQKEHTLVGTGGVSLSGGQQQRVVSTAM